MNFRRTLGLIIACLCNVFGIELPLPRRFNLVKEPTPQELVLKAESKDEYDFHFEWRRSEFKNRLYLIVNGKRHSTVDDVSSYAPEQLQKICQSLERQIYWAILKCKAMGVQTDYLISEPLNPYTIPKDSVVFTVKSLATGGCPVCGNSRQLECDPSCSICGRTRTPQNNLS